MQVRVFEAIDMASGLKKIKDELGPDALILSTRTIRNGKLGLLGKPMIEITAAVDADFSSPSDKYPAGNGRGVHPQAAGQKNSSFSHRVDDSVEQFLDMSPPAFSLDKTENQKPVQKKTPVRRKKNVTKDANPTLPSQSIPARHQTVAALASESENNNGKGGALQGEVDELKDLVKSLVGQISNLSKNDNSNQKVQVQNGQQAEKSTSGQLNDREAINDKHGKRNFDSQLIGNPLRGDHLLAELTDRGINSQTARTIATFLRESLSEQELTDADHVSATICAIIEDFIKVEPPIYTPGARQQRLALVGPTGVGKTTTLAKIAASYLAKHSNSIALITIDTYRIAAVEQLKVYGEIMNLPVDVVINPEQLAVAIEKHSDKDLILIDTAGRSPRDSLSIDELATFLTPELAIDVHLVLSAGTRDSELLDTIDRFKKLNVSKTIFTKVDECANLGVLLNIQAKNPRPLSYLTNGQRVPEDLLEISPKIVAELIMSQHEGFMHD